MGSFLQRKERAFWPVERLKLDDRRKDPSLSTTSTIQRWRGGDVRGVHVCGSCCRGPDPAHHNTSLKNNTTDKRLNPHSDCWLFQTCQSCRRGENCLPRQEPQTAKNLPKENRLPSIRNPRQTTADKSEDPAMAMERKQPSVFSPPVDKEESVAEQGYLTRSRILIRTKKGTNRLHLRRALEIGNSALYLCF